MNLTKKVYIVILNWNGWRDTIECLESLLRNNYTDYKIIVCDNGSSDESVERIKDWIGSLNHCGTTSVIIKELLPSLNPVLIEYSEYLIGEFIGNNFEISRGIQLHLIRIESNIGFAGGNNVALRLLMHQDDWDYVWLLNNDTVVMPDALSALVQRMEESSQSGMCGSLMPYYNNPNTIWAQGGGSFNRWLAKSECIGNGLPLAKGLERDEVEKRMKYVAGASMLVSREFIEETGLMCEDYFLYFEEPDWAFRGQHRFRLVYAPESIVYHKVGMSTSKGAQSDTGIDAPADYIFRNSLRFTLKFFPMALPLVFIRVSFNWIKVWFANHLQRMWRLSCG